MFSGLKCYYEDFLAGFDIFKALTLGGSKKSEQEEKKCFMYFPYIENVTLEQNMTYANFFENCNENRIDYDVSKKSGILFIPYDELSRNSIGIMIVGNTFYYIK